MSKVCEYLGDIKGTVEQGLLDKDIGPHTSCIHMYTTI